MISAEECELIGAFIGDGHVYRGFRKYIVGFTGDRVNDAAYFDHLRGLLKETWGIDKKPFFRSGGLRIVFQSKSVALRLENFYKFPTSAKCYSVSIPDFLISDWAYARHVLRGLVDTDGSVFVSKKPGVEKYPSLEITTVSPTLAKQVRAILVEWGFRVANLRLSYSKRSKTPAYKIALFGWKNLLMWFNEIGFSNPVKYDKAKLILQAKFGNL